MARTGYGGQESDFDHVRQQFQALRTRCTGDDGIIQRAGGVSQRPFT